MIGQGERKKGTASKAWGRNISIYRPEDQAKVMLLHYDQKNVYLLAPDQVVNANNKEKKKLTRQK